MDTGPAGCTFSYMSVFTVLLCTLRHHCSRPWASLSGITLCLNLQLEEIDVVSTSQQTKGGRLITANGQRDLDLIAARIERSTRDEVDFEEE